MRSSIRQFGVVTLFALSSFVMTSVAQPVPAHAVVGAALWPVFPLVIVGAALEVSAVGAGIVGCAASSEGYYYRARHLTGAAIGQALLGLVFLDEKSELGTAQHVTAQQAKTYQLTDEEMQAYNQAVDEGDMNGIFQQATQRLSTESNHEQAKEVMGSLLSQLPAPAHSAFNKIAQYIVTHR